MAQKTYDELTSEASGIIEETRAGFNTAARIGNVFQDVIDSVQLTLSSAEPYYAVDLSAGIFQIQTNGIYEFVSNGHAMTFPNPTNYTGQKVTLINSNESAVSFDGNRPVSVNNEVEYTDISGGIAMVIISTGNRWILISQF